MAWSGPSKHEHISADGRTPTCRLVVEDVEEKCRPPRPSPRIHGRSSTSAHRDKNTKSAHRTEKHALQMGGLRDISLT